MMPEPYEQQVHALFTTNGWTLGIAESCTGGAVAARLTALPGASAYFLGSVVAYSNAWKEKILGVGAGVLKEQGAVSEAVVRAMALGILQQAGSDFALAVSGIAGPDGGTASKPVGTVWCAVVRRGSEPLSWELHLEGGREQVINGSVNALLGGLLRYAQQQIKE